MMSVTLSLPDLTTSEINIEVGPLSDCLEYEGVPKPERKKENDETLDAGTLLYIAVPLVIPMARGLGKFLATRFGTSVKVTGPKGSIVISNAESGDLAAITSKLQGVI